MSSLLLRSESLIASKKQLVTVLITLVGLEVGSNERSQNLPFAHRRAGLTYSVRIHIGSVGQRISASPGLLAAKVLSVESVRPSCLTGKSQKQSKVQACRLVLTTSLFIISSYHLYNLEIWEGLCESCKFQGFPETCELFLSWV